MVTIVEDIRPNVYPDPTSAVLNEKHASAELHEHGGRPLLVPVRGSHPIIDQRKEHGENGDRSETGPQANPQSMCPRCWGDRIAHVNIPPASPTIAEDSPVEVHLTLPNGAVPPIHYILTRPECENAMEFWFIGHGI